MPAIYLFVLLALTPLAWADAYYWVDENGKRHYSDRVPPQESKRERKVIDDRGFTVETLPQERTAAELEAEQQAIASEEAARKETRRERAEQTAYDNLLLTTYENVGQLEHARDDRLSLMDASLLVEVEAHADNHKRLGKLEAEEKQLLQQGKKVPDSLRKRIDDITRSIRVNEKNIAELRRQRAEVDEKYSKDIARYELLKSAAD